MNLFGCCARAFARRRRIDQIWTVGGDGQRARLRHGRRRPAAHALGPPAASAPEPGRALAAAQAARGRAPLVVAVRALEEQAPARAGVPAPRALHMRLPRRGVPRLGADPARVPRPVGPDRQVAGAGPALRAALRAPLAVHSGRLGAHAAPRVQEPRARPDPLGRLRFGGVPPPLRPGQALARREHALAVRPQDRLAEPAAHELQLGAGQGAHDPVPRVLHAQPRRRPRAQLPPPRPRRRARGLAGVAAQGPRGGRGRVRVRG